VAIRVHKRVLKAAWMAVWQLPDWLADLTLIALKFISAAWRSTSYKISDRVILVHALNILELPLPKKIITYLWSF
jgi:hypothetical protein